MTIYERIEKIRDTYLENATACSKSGLKSSYEIIIGQVAILNDYMDTMPIGVAEMYAGEK